MLSDRTAARMYLPAGSRALCLGGELHDISASRL
jgi:hypothetical protein